MILITHDLSVLAETCDRVAIMYGGQIAEIGAGRASSTASPQHPYTQRLLGAFPAIGGPRELAPAIPGVPPDPADGRRGAGSRRAATAHGPLRDRGSRARAPRRRPRGALPVRAMGTGRLDRPAEGPVDAGPPGGDRPGGPDEPPTWAEIPGGMAMPLPDQPTGDPG